MIRRTGLGWKSGKYLKCFLRSEGVWEWLVVLSGFIFRKCCIYFEVEIPGIGKDDMIWYFEVDKNVLFVEYDKYKKCVILKSMINDE